MVGLPSLINIYFIFQAKRYMRSLVRCVPRRALLLIGSGFEQLLQAQQAVSCDSNLREPGSWRPAHLRIARFSAT